MDNWVLLLWFLFLCFISDCTGSLLQLKGSLIMALRLRSSEACGILVPHPGIQPTSPALAGRFLTTGPPGKSPDNCFNILAYFIPIFFLYGTLFFFFFHCLRMVSDWYRVFISRWLLFFTCHVNLSFLSLPVVQKRDACCTTSHQ